MRTRNRRGGVNPGKLQNFWAVLMIFALLLSGCGQKADLAPDIEESIVNTDIVSPVTKDLAEVDKSIYMDPSQDVEIRVRALLEQMTLEEKAAQLMQPEQAGLDASDVTKYGIGSVLSGGGSAPSTGNTAEDWAERINELKQAALESRLGIPLLYGVDAVHGNNNVYEATVFPHNIALGAAANEELTQAIGQAVAEEVRACGIQWTFAPTLGNAWNERWGRTYECFGEDYDLTARLGAAYIRGFQGEKKSEEYLDDTHVLACAKHYIGEGYTTDGVNQGNVEMSQEEFDALLSMGVLNPYTAALNEGIRTVMVSYNSVDGVKCHENKHLIQEVLKDGLGFTGLVVSDYNGIQQTSGATYKEQVRLALDAGIDLFMEVSTWKDCMDNIVQLVKDGDISEERLNDAVSRVLRVKFEAGLFEETIGGETEQALLEKFGGEEHRALARQAVRESLVLLKNDMVGDVDALTALKQAENIQVTGQKAYDLGSQCGGWTISWQGMQGMTTRGTTIIEGFALALQEQGVELEHNVDGQVAAEKDAVIAVFGEVPYAETDGDRTPAGLTISAKDQELLEALRTNLEEREDKIPAVAIIVAGRPLDIEEYFDMFDAVIMAWLPGTEGSGVADVLFGEYDFNGVLPYTWMKDAADIPLKKEAALTGTEVAPEKILFPRGYGLNKAGNSILK